MTHKSKTLVVFDIDGTLTDSVVAHQKAFTESLIELGVTKIDSNYGEYKHHTDSYIAKVIYEGFFESEFTQEILDQFEEMIYQKLNLQVINEIAGARDLIGSLLLDPSFDYCFATGSLKKPAKYKLECLYLDFHSDILVSSNNLNSRDDIVKTAIENSKVYYKQENYERIISIGDGLWDLKTANNLGIEFIGIGKKNKDILIENGCEKYFDDLTKIDINEV